MHDTTDTIAALCTPSGASARAIVRLSGDHAFAVVDSVFIADAVMGSGEPGRAQTGGIKRCVRSGVLQIELAGESLPCPALVYFMPAPASYTRQDVAEIQLPGSLPLVGALLAQLSRHGVRQAQPGEFTLRAFLNGRIDLAQAQAVEGIIHAQNESERRAALARLGSGLSARFARWKQTLVEVAGTLEATLDFEDEELEPGLEAALYDRLSTLAGECRTLAQTAEAQSPEEDGLRVLLAGLTNAGKSALLNRLVGREAALVSPERSTTRDRTVHPLSLDRYRLQLEDCPGIDRRLENDSMSETSLAAAASRHASRHYAANPLLLIVVDAQTPLSSQKRADAELADFFRALPPCRALLVYNKCDIDPNAAPAGQTSDSTPPESVAPRPQATAALPPALQESIGAIRAIAAAATQVGQLGECYCSALTGYGINALKHSLQRLAQDDPAPGSDLTRREASELAAAARHCAAAAEALTIAPELAAVELRAAFEAVARAGGEGYSEDILASIFARFCIGK